MSSDRNRRKFIVNAGSLLATVIPGISLAGNTAKATATTANRRTPSLTAFKKPTTPDFDQYVGEAHEVRRLRLYNPRTDEKASVVYWYKGEYVLHGLHQLDLILRDYRDNVSLRIDTKVLDFLYGVYAQFDTNERIQILSGYRTQNTNDMLRQQYENVARNSWHMQGKAIDFNIPGQTTSDLQQAATNLRAGGVGYYPNAEFIHIDSGPIRTWTRMG